MTASFWDWSNLLGGDLSQLLGLGSSLNMPPPVPTGTSPTGVVMPPGPTLGGAPPAAASTGGLLGGPPLGHKGLLGDFGDSVLGHGLAGALAGIGKVQPGTGMLGALGQGAQGAMDAGAARQQEQMKDWYMQQTVQQANQKTQTAQQQRDYLANAAPPPGVDPAQWKTYVQADPEGALAVLGKTMTPDKPGEPPKIRTQHLPNGMDQDQTWNSATGTWESTGQSYNRFAPTSPGTSVNVQMPAMESSASKAAGDVIGKDVGSVITQGRQAATNIADLDRLQSLLDQVHTGKYTGTIVDLKKAALAAGVDLGALGITDNTAVTDAARAMSNQMALKLRGDPSGGMPGAMSDKDREFLSSMTPNIENTPEGNKLMIEWNRRIEQRKEQQAAVARNYIKSHGGNIDAGVYDEWQKYADAHPLFTDADRQAAAAAAGGGQGGAPAQTPATTWTREKPATIAAGASEQAQQEWVDRLPVGSWFVNPADGRLIQKTH